MPTRERRSLSLPENPNSRASPRPLTVIFPCEFKAAGYVAQYHVLNG